MKRWPRVMMMLAMWALIGAGVTVVVAWGAVRGWSQDQANALGTVRSKDFGFSQPHPWVPHARSWPFAVPETWSRPDSEWIEATAWWTEVSASGFERSTVTVHMATRKSFGWPCRALTDESWIEGINGKISSGYDGATIPLPWVRQYFGIAQLPLRPFWPGFAVDTILYGAIAWGLWQVPLLLRRRHRRARNRCIRCGYSLAGLAADAPCPECGGGPR